MWWLLETFLRRLDYSRYKHNINRALALHLRGEVRSDGLLLKTVCNRLEIQWSARDIHPWDRYLPPEIKMPLLAEQSLTDTEAAITRLFDALPEVDVIDLTVVEPESEAMILSGTVHRSTLSTARRDLLSVGMRLMDLGVRYRFQGAHFESRESESCQDTSKMNASNSAPSSANYAGR